VSVRVNGGDFAAVLV